MPESQLKRLKASLRAAGVTGQQKPKKASKRRKVSGGGNTDSRIDRNVALQSIREEFNPFELKTNRQKHDVGGRGRVKGAQGRPGLSKQIGEENRKRTLLVEMQRRNKVGGIVDRRFGENDPTMAPEDRMLERFTREKQKRVRGGEIFNLEDDDDELTHFGKSLGGLTDDFDAGNDLMLSEEDEETVAAARKRRLEDEEGSGEDEGRPERKKSKAEVMKEVIAKSKLHKYERQKTKEDDDDEREKLDAQMGDIWALLGTTQPSKTSGPGTGANQEPIPGRDEISNETDKSMNPERLAMIEDKDINYDMAVREMMFDRRSKPSERTKTEEEKAEEESERLRKLEDARQRRMRGEEDSEDEKIVEGGDAEDDLEFGDAQAYGLGRGIPEAVQEKQNENPDELLDGDYEVSEDGYVDIDDDGIVHGSGDELSDDFDSDNSIAAASGDEVEEDSDEEDFLADVLPEKAGKGGVMGPATSDLSEKLAGVGINDKLAFTFPCPQSHGEMLEAIKDIPVEDLPIVVQRIRVLHHPKLHADNKTKLANFSSILLGHILHIANFTAPNIPFSTIETLIRHLHALAKSYPEKVAESFRDGLRDLHEKRTSGDMNPGDLILLTAIGTIFPTSDHFHLVVTPAMIVIGKWLGQVVPDSIERLAMGAYLVTLCIEYQALSKRYIPEAINYVYQGLSLLAPTKQDPLPGNFPYHEPVEPFRISAVKKEWKPRKLRLTDIFTATATGDERADKKHSLLHTFIVLLVDLARLWAGKPAFAQVFEPSLEILAHLSSQKRPLHDSTISLLTTSQESLTSHLNRANLSRRPQELHHHRPLLIKTYIPKFEETYSLDKRSYDPDRDRVALAKLKAEHKRERKGALRELRKDSAFVAREKLKEDKKNSKEYHAKMARLTAMIQSEEGMEANIYKREKAGRKGKK